MDSTLSWEDQNRPPPQHGAGEPCARALVLPDTSGIPYPNDSFRNFTAAEVAGKISVTSLVMMLALLGNWRC